MEDQITMTEQDRIVALCNKMDMDICELTTTLLVVVVGFNLESLDGNLKQTMQHMVEHLNEIFAELGASKKDRFLH